MLPMLLVGINRVYLGPLANRRLGRLDSGNRLGAYGLADRLMDFNNAESRLVKTSISNVNVKIA